MKVQSLMTSPALTCKATADLGAAARIMLERNCGCLPLVDDHGHVVGIVTPEQVSSPKAVGA